MINDKKAISYLKKIFTGFNYKAAVSSKKGKTHLRVRFSKPGEEQSIFDSVLGKNVVSITHSEFQCSGQFDTFIIEFKEDYGPITAKTTAYFVNNAPKAGGIIGKKELTPNALDIVDKPLAAMPISRFLNFMDSEIKKKVEKPKVQMFLINLLNASVDTDTFNTNLAQSFTQQDLAQIANDFGEISGATWLAKKEKATAIEYPGRSNEPLIDYFIYIKDKKLSISAKSAKGAAPTLSGLVPQFTSFISRCKDQKLKTAAKIIYEFANLGVVDGILFLAKELLEKYRSCPGYKKLTDMMGPQSLTNKQAINTYINTKVNNAIIAEQIFKDYYTTIKRFPKNYGRTDSSIANVFKFNKAKLYGIITSPLAYHVCDELNKIGDFEEVLNRIIAEVDVRQVHMYLTKTSVKYKDFAFKDRKFKWDPGQISVPNPDNKKLGFKVI